VVDSLFRGRVTWDRRADDRIAVFHPAHIGILRTHFEGLLTIASRRLQQHNSGEELGPLDCRIEAICGMTKGLNHYWPRPLVICRILPVCAAAHAGKDSYEPLSYVEKLLI
jgi:hypothetical protein